jgi:hypothetical protein
MVTVLALDLAEVRELRVEVEDLQPRGTLSRADALPPPAASKGKKCSDASHPALSRISGKVVEVTRAELTLAKT